MASIRKLLQGVAFPLLVCCVALAGCKGNGTNGTATALPPPAVVAPTPPPAVAPPPPPVVGVSNEAPKISGSPITSAKVNEAYFFQPTAIDPDGDKISFSITNKPGWAAFDSNTGALSGTPSSSSTGTVRNVQIVASDGKANAILAPFDIVVSATATIGSATLSWQPPTQNVDGSPLTNLAGYVIRYGTAAGALDVEVRIPNPGITTAVVENLAPATWYFTVSAYTSVGVESAPSVAGSKTVG